ncbi:MAG: hypothetical protein ABID38_02280 [Candidatus Diapherotrites archaeon]
MTINITLPEMKSASNKDKIISILSRKWPLTTKEIYNALQREYGVEISYQAVHKIIVQLQNEGVMVKNGKDLEINKEWIKSVNKFGNELEQIYSNPKSKINFENSRPLNLKFNKFMELARFLVNDFFIQFPNPEKKNAVCFMRHAFGAIGASDVEHDNFKKMFSYCNHYGINAKDTFLDNWNANYLAKLGKKSTTGTKFSCKEDTFIQGDYIGETYYEMGFITDVDNYYSSIKNAKDISVEEYFEKILNKPTEINVILTKNPYLADKLRQEAEDIWGKNFK